LTATADSTWAGVRLYVDLVSVATALYVTVTRTDPDGTQSTVRSGDLTPIPGGTTLAFDFEAPLGAAVTYSAQGYVSAGVTAGSPVTAGVTVPTTAAMNAWVKSLDAPVLSKSLPVTVNGPWARKRVLQEMKALGRPNKVVHSFGLTGREGDLEVAVFTAADVAAVENLFEQDRLLIQFPPAALMADLFCQAGDLEPVAVGPRATNAQKWRTHVIETDRPPTAGSTLLYPGSSYTTGAATWASYTAVAAARTTYIDWSDG
jgi:hypothetical protein